MGHGNYVLDGSRSPMGRDTFERERGVPLSYCKVQEQSAVICAKTAEPIEMPFGLWARMVPVNHVLDGGPALLRYVAMATNFGMQFAINGFVGYNFGCVIASDMLFDSRGGFRGHAIRRRHSRDSVLGSLPWQPTLG